VPPGRSRDRFVSLPDELQGDGQPATGQPPEAPPTIFEDLIDEGAGMRGRITVYCVAEALDRKALELRLRERGGAALLHQYPDVLYGLFETAKVGRLAAVGGGLQQSRQLVSLLAVLCMVNVWRFPSMFPSTPS
jgi:hypothetical protein